MEFTITILSSGSGSPAGKRLNQSAQYIRILNHRFLIDCGESAQQQIVNCHLSYLKIDRIFISHLHADHYGGLFNLVNTMNLNHRHSCLHIYGPKALKKIIRVQLEAGNIILRFPVEFHEISPGFRGIIFEDNSVSVIAFPLKHRIPTSGFTFTEICNKRKIKKDAIEGKEIPVKAFKLLIAGQDFLLENGTKLSVEDFTLPPPKARKYVYMSDTSPYDPGEEILSETDILYHEATYGSRHKDKTLFTGHSSAADAARLAGKYKVKKLIIGHFSTRYTSTEDIEAEAKEYFANTVLAQPGLCLFITRQN